MHQIIYDHCILTLNGKILYSNGEFRFIPGLMDSLNSGVKDIQLVRAVWQKIPIEDKRLTGMVGGVIDGLIPVEALFNDNSRVSFLKLHEDAIFAILDNFKDERIKKIRKYLNEQIPRLEDFIARIGGYNNNSKGTIYKRMKLKEASGMTESLATYTLDSIFDFIKKLPIRKDKNKLTKRIKDTLVSVGLYSNDKYDVYCISIYLSSDGYLGIIVCHTQKVNNKGHSDYRFPITNDKEEILGISVECGYNFYNIEDAFELPLDQGQFDLDDDFYA